MGCQLRDWRCQVPRQEVFPQKEESKAYILHISLEFRDYPASATCLKIKNVQVPKLQSAFASRTLPQGQQVFSWGRYVPGNNYPPESAPRMKLGTEHSRGRGSWERERRGKGEVEVAWCLCLQPPWTLRTQRQCQETETS